MKGDVDMAQDNSTPRRRRTQLYADEYASWQQTQNDSIPLVHTKEENTASQQPITRAQEPQNTGFQANANRQGTQSTGGFRAQQGRNVQPQQNWNQGVQQVSPYHASAFSNSSASNPYSFDFPIYNVNTSGYQQQASPVVNSPVVNSPVIDQPVTNSPGINPPIVNNSSGYTAPSGYHASSGYAAQAYNNTAQTYPQEYQNVQHQPMMQQSMPYQPMMQQSMPNQQIPQTAAPAQYDGHGGGRKPPSGMGGFAGTSGRKNGSHPHRNLPKGSPLLRRILLYGGMAAAVVVLVIAGRAVAQNIAAENARNALEASVTAYDDRYVPNVYVDGIDLSGMTREEAETAVTEHANQQRDSWKVRLTYQGQLVREVTSSDLNMTVDVDEALEEAWQVGHTGTIDERKEEMDALAESPYEGYSATPSGDNTEIDNILTTIANQAYIAPVDAQIVFNPSNFNSPLSIVSETVGRYMDVTEAKNQLYRMVSTLESGEIALETQELQPETTKAMLEPKIQLRATAYTPISTTSTENRNKNIQVAFDKINGYMLKPGETFSFNTVVGERTQKNGFYEAIEYAYGSERMGYGGGVCQVSTTLYLAAVKANLTIVKREPHSDAVGYTDYGKDATVSDKRIDFKFKNDTDSTIFIVCTVTKDTRYDKSKKVCLVSIYGESLGTGVTYDIVTNTVEILAAPEEPEIVKDTKHEYTTYVDQEYVYRKAKEGCVVESYRVKYVNGVETERTYLYTDTYKAKSEIIYVGTLERTDESE